MSENQARLADDIRSAINSVSRENTSNTPDFILAEYMLACLSAFETASLAREKWYGQHLHIFGTTTEPRKPICDPVSVASAMSAESGPVTRGRV